MRDITFRGKSVSTGEWVYGYLIGRAEDSGKPCQGKFFIDNGEPFNKAVEVIPETIGQYTGIIDTAGEMLFEGDIILVPGPDGEDIEPVFVKYDQKRALFAAFTQDGKWKFDMDRFPEYVLFSSIYDQEESA